MATNEENIGSLSPEDRDYKIKAFAMQAIQKIAESAMEKIAAHIRPTQTEEKK